MKIVELVELAHTCKKENTQGFICNAETTDAGSICGNPAAKINSVRCLGICQICLDKAKADTSSFSDKAAERKALPICTGCLDYFPDALAAVAEVSRIGNEQHNPGQPLHWERGKSNDQEDALLRHLVDRGKLDTDGARHSAKVAWRALALLQLEIEKAKAAK